MIIDISLKFNILEICYKRDLSAHEWEIRKATENVNALSNS